MKVDLTFNIFREQFCKHLPFKVMWMDETGSIIYANDLFCERLGYAPEEIEHLSVFDINPTTTVEKWKAHWEIVKTQKANQFKTVHQTKHGDYYDVEVSAHFLSDNGLSIIAAIVKDISESRFFNNLITQTQELTNSCGWEYNVQDNSVIVTEQSFKIFETTDKNDFLPNNIARRFSESDKLEELISEAISNGKSYDEVLTIKTKSNQTQFVRCIGNPVAKNGKIYRLIGTYQEVTKTKEKEQLLNSTISKLEALKAELESNMEIISSEHKYRELVENTTDIIYSLNAVGEFTFVSSAWKRMLGHEIRDVIGKSFTEFVHPDDIEHCFKNLQKAIETGETVTDIKYRVKHIDDTWRWHNSSGSIKKNNSESKEIFFDGLARDITQQKHDEIQIAKQTAIQKILIDLASNFINTKLDNVDDSINLALKELGNFFKVDRVHVFNYNWGKGTTSNTYEWCAEGIKPEIENSQNIPIDSVPEWGNLHKRGESLKIVDASDPNVDPLFKEVLLSQDIKSIITIPMMSNNTCIGFVGFDSVNRIREYTAIEEEMLLVFANMLVNISERQTAQEELFKSRGIAEQKAKQLLEAQKIANLASWYLDLANSQVTWSKELYNMYGFDPSLPPPSYAEQEKIFTPDSWKILTESVSKAISEGLSYEHELRFVRADKSIGWMWAKGEAVVDREHNVIALKGVAQDITTRKHLEIELKNSKEKYKTTAKRLQVATASAGIGICEWDIGNDTLNWDDRLFELYGHDREKVDLDFELWSNSIHPRDLNQALEDIKNAIEGKQEFNSLFRIIRPDGSERFIKAYAHVLRDNNNVPTKFIGVNMDVTESQIHQRKLEFKNKQLIDFSNILAHNLRAPLVNIGMLVDLIDENEDPEESKEFIEQLKLVLDHLNEVFNELMESIQIKQDLDIRSQKIELSKHVDKILQGLSSQISTFDAKINVDLSNAQFIEYPTKYIDSILSNLISNALKYRSPNRPPIISIKTEKHNRDVILSVADNGLGLDMNLAKKNLFKIRKVFHNHPDAKGFGLFLIKTQIDAMEGEIWVESEPDKGSTFFVKFKNAAL